MILEWPVELIELVLVNLHPLHAVKCRQVCRFLRQLIDSSIELQLRIELAQDGHLLRQRGKDPAVELRKRVLSNRRALETFHPRLFFETNTPGFWTDIYDLNDGVIGRLLGNREEPEDHRVVYYELACPKGNERWQATWEFPDMKLVDFSFWAAGDIQILTEERDAGSCKRLHFRTISTNSPHPLAARAWLDLREPEIAVWDTSVTILHDAIYLMISKPDDYTLDGKAFAINWKTGELVLPHRVVNDATFLAKDLLLLLLNAGNEGHTSTPMFEIFSLAAKEVLYRCLLPFSAPIEAISLTGNQNFNFPRNPYLSQPKEFVPDFKLNILAVEMYLETVRHEPFSVLVIIAIQKLLDICQSSALGSPGEILEWDKWGPDATRWLPIELSGTGSLCVYGSRIVVWDRSRTWDALAVLDFNPRSLRRHSSSELDQNMSVIIEPSISRYHLTQETLEITSCLPFKKLVFGVFHYRNIDLDGMNLVSRMHKDSLYVLSLSVEDEEQMECQAVIIRTSLTRVEEQVVGQRDHVMVRYITFGYVQLYLQKQSWVPLVRLFLEFELRVADEGGFQTTMKYRVGFPSSGRGLDLVTGPMNKVHWRAAQERKAKGVAIGAFRKPRN